MSTSCNDECVIVTANHKCLLWINFESSNLHYFLQGTGSIHSGWKEKRCSRLWQCKVAYNRNKFKLGQSVLPTPAILIHPDTSRLLHLTIIAKHFDEENATLMKTRFKSSLQTFYIKTCGILLKTYWRSDWLVSTSHCEYSYYTME